jgi:hypothetical protein
MEINSMGLGLGVGVGVGGTGSTNTSTEKDLTNKKLARNQQVRRRLLVTGGVFSVPAKLAQKETTKVIDH